MTGAPRMHDAFVASRSQVRAGVWEIHLDNVAMAAAAALAGGVATLAYYAFRGQADRTAAGRARVTRPRGREPTTPVTDTATTAADAGASRSITRSRSTALARAPHIGTSRSGVHEPQVEERLLAADSYLSRRAGDLRIIAITEAGLPPQLLAGTLAVVLSPVLRPMASQMGTRPAYLFGP